MKLHLEPTDRIVEIATADGTVPGRVWQGHSDSGIEVVVVITRVAVAKESDQAEFEAALTSIAPSTAAVEAFPMRMVL